MKTGDLIGAVLAAACGAGAAAQEAMYTNAATMPSPGTWVVREQLNYFRYGSSYEAGVKWTEIYEAATSVQYGLARDWSLTVDVPVQLKERKIEATGVGDWDTGVEDIEALLKWRFYKEDSGGVDTFRAAMLAGAHVASGDDHDFSSQSVNPDIGAVATLVRGRHGFNQEFMYRFNTGGDADDNLGGEGPADAFFYNSAYVYRLAPERFTSDSTGAWYATLELNGLYETNGDNEIRWAPGLMYEGRTWGLELMAQFPLYDGVEHRAELDYSFGVGIRLLF